MAIDPFSPGFFKRLQQLKIRTRRSFLGSRQGGHTSLRRGHGLEFSDFRAYAPGDDFRHIDWGIYGRTDRIYVREFRAEQDLNVLILFDASASMDFPRSDTGKQSKFDVARALALSLGYIALAAGDSVTFCPLGQSNTPRFVGPRSLPRAIKSLNDIKAKGRFELKPEIRAAISGQKIPGKCFFISDCLVDLEDLFGALDILRAKNFEIAVIQVLAPDELNLEFSSVETLVDAETGEEIDFAADSAIRKEYVRRLGTHVEAIERYCWKAGILHLLISSAENVPDVVLKKFPELGLVR